MGLPNRTVTTDETALARKIAALKARQEQRRIATAEKKLQLDECLERCDREIANLEQLQNAGDLRGEDCADDTTFTLPTLRLVRK